MPAVWDTIKNFLNPSKAKPMEGKDEMSNCSELNRCMEILELMLDNEASPEQEEYVTEHIEKCMICFEQYEVEKHIRELIKTKMADMPVPEGLANQIRSKIQFYDQ